MQHVLQSSQKPSKYDRQLTAILAADGHNIANMLNKSKGEWAYSMFDMEKKAPTEETVKKMEQIDGVVRVRVL